jgi:hypothetical protein
MVFLRKQVGAQRLYGRLDEGSVMELQLRQGKPALLSLGSRMIDAH